ncbi:hypothetical protein HZA33_05150 [Candidatus Pacearchaeota archaeon]|nr:hypothetical protein [Candidatus Pacearchaeota archaeon]
MVSLKKVLYTGLAAVVLLGVSASGVDKAQAGLFDNLFRRHRTEISTTLDIGRNYDGRVEVFYSSNYDIWQPWMERDYGREWMERDYGRDGSLRGQSGELRRIEPKEVQPKPTEIRVETETFKVPGVRIVPKSDYKTERDREIREQQGRYRPYQPEFRGRRDSFLEHRIKIIHEGRVITVDINRYFEEPRVIIIR